MPGRPGCAMQELPNLVVPGTSLEGKMRPELGEFLELSKENIFPTILTRNSIILICINTRGKKEKDHEHYTIIDMEISTSKS